MSDPEKPPLPGDYFPSDDDKKPSEFDYKKLGGYDIYKSGKHWMAFVACENKYGRIVKWFRWNMRQGLWKVDLCNMKVDYLDFNSLEKKIQSLKNYYDIK